MYSGISGRFEPLLSEVVVLIIEILENCVLKNVSGKFFVCESGFLTIINTFPSMISMLFYRFSIFRAANLARAIILIFV